MVEGDIQGSGVGGNSSGQSRAKPREEGLETTAGVDAADSSANCGLAGGALQARLDGVDGENGNPHGNTSRTTGGQDSGHGELAGGVAVRILGCQGALDIFVSSEVGGRAGTITGQGHCASTEDTADATLLVQLPNHVQSTGVLGLLSRRRRVLALDLQEHLDSLKRSCDQGHGDGGEETGGGDLANGVLGGVVLHAHFGELANERLAHVITLGKC